MNDQLFKSAMSKFTTGVTVITTKVDEKVHGMTANAFMSVSLEPKLILISVHEKASMNKYIKESGKFAVSILAEGQEDMSMYFAGQIKEEKNIDFVQFNEMPVLENSIVHLTCDVANAHIEGDHTLFIGAVTDIAVNESNPLALYNGKYQKVN
ncbi:flavin reductase family protein [Alteribacillus sp. YIM 98480]|uniref:flavin reductase family protein n=1 Tax=Alteribacillus sp. YIM 98480 TaxID=2606599 RepID=UPI00131E3948|nr:flavin reductase family protein [Alteribacillus sp. YIM 98480]